MLKTNEYFEETHDMIRDSARRLVEKDILPFIDDWEEEGTFPRELYNKVGEAGLLGIGYPEQYGGTGGDFFQPGCIFLHFVNSGSIQFRLFKNLHPSHK